MDYIPLFLFLMILPWMATVGGSALAWKIKLSSRRREGLLLGFAAGIMLAATIWSLLLPGFEQGGGGVRGVLLVSAGFLLGCLGMLFLDRLVPHQHADGSPPEGPQKHMSRPMLLVMAVALHNIPEGMALGIVLASSMQPEGMTWTMALMFGIGLALQNFPEGMAVVLPMRQAGLPMNKCRKWGILASFAEPAAALLGWAAASLLGHAGTVIMPVFLGLAAGAMLFIIIEELVPESQAAAEGGHTSTYGLLIGFWVMAVLGVLGG